MTHKVYVLQTYPEQPSDGLSTVYHRVASVAPVVSDSLMLCNATILVSGIPTLYLDRITTNNRNVCYTTFESSQLPSHWVHALNHNYAACCVPHESVRQVFIESGISIPIFVVQQGYTRFPPPIASMPDDHIFRIGFLGVPVRRKNLPLLFSACELLIAEGFSIQLVIHVPQYYDWMQNNNLHHIREASFVEWTEGARDAQQLSDWFACLSCYVFPSSGEGWSFTPRESLALGVPTVISDIPVHKEMINADYVTPIKSRGTSMASMETSNCGSWLSIHSDDIADSLRLVLNDHNTAQSIACEGAEWISRHWKNENCRAELSKVLYQL